MLKNNLKDMSNIVLLRSDKILYELLDNRTNINNKSKSYQYGMQDFYPNSFRKGTIENSMSHVIGIAHNKFTLDYDFNFLDTLFDEYLCIDGSHIYARKELLDKYSSVISKIHPFNIIGYKLATLYNKDRLNINNIKEYARYITPLGLHVDRDFKDYADNHIHLGGASDTALNFLALLSQPTPKEFYTSKVFESLPRINEFSYINNGNISFGNLIDIAKYCVSVINNHCLNETKVASNITINLNSLLKYGKLSMVDIDFNSFNMLDKFNQNAMQINSALLNEVIVNKRKGYSTKQWFLYNILIFSLYEKESSNKGLRKVIKIFIHATNILRTYMVMSQNIGLSHFSDFFNSKIRKKEKKKHNNIASNIISNGTTKVESKISPNAVLDKDKEFLKYKLAFDKEIIKQESFNVELPHHKYFLDTNKSKRNYHFCIHFIRDNEKERVSNTEYLLPRYSKLRGELKKEAKKLSGFLYNESQVINKFDFYRKFHPKQMEVLKHKAYLENRYIDISKLITSIDVAGDENITPPEVFAPAIKYLRRDIKKQDDFMSDYIKYQRDGHDFTKHNKLRVSIHAGEDFNHIVTGMRKVHESVKFYHMEQKDRLGHALAIDLNPKEWCELNGDIFIPKQEHLDNLVWLYHQSIEVLGHYKHTHKLREKYTKHIKEMCKDIYDEIYTPDELYKAWKLREYCPIDGFANDCEYADEYIDSVSSKKDKVIYKKAESINKKYQTSKKVRDNGNEIIKVEYTNLKI